MSEKKRKEKKIRRLYLTAGKTTQNLGKVILIPWRTRERDWSKCVILQDVMVLVIKYQKKLKEVQLSNNAQVKVSG